MSAQPHTPYRRSTHPGAATTADAAPSEACIEALWLDDPPGLKLQRLGARVDEDDALAIIGVMRCSNL